MNKLINEIRAFRFWTKWLFMSPRQRYTYFWNRSKKSWLVIKDEAAEPVAVVVR